MGYEWSGMSYQEKQVGSEAAMVFATAPPLSPDERDLQERCRRLGLYGLLTRWDEFGSEDWIDQLLDVEEGERARRSLERRRRNAKLGLFRSLADFNWGWPESIDRGQVEEIMKLRFMRCHMYHLVRI